MLKEILEKFRARKEAMNNIDEDYRINKTLEQRRKSANERELERHFEEQRQKQIALSLQQIRKKRNEVAWKGEKNILQEPNIFKNHHSILTDNPNMSIMGRGSWL